MQAAQVFEGRRQLKKKRGRKARMIWLTAVASIVFLLVLGWTGLHIKPSSFPSYSQSAVEFETRPVPPNLPAPVERFYTNIYGDAVPIIHSAVISGRARLGPVPGLPKFPARYRFIHEAGQNYRHYIELTWLGFPILRVNESYIDGRSFQDLPWASIENIPTANQAANLGMWSESIWLPSLFLTDPRVRWEAIDNLTALLIVPFENDFERFIVRFDPVTGYISWLESMRYKGETNEKVLWLNEAHDYAELAGQIIPITASAIWIDDGKPWATFTVEELVLNADVSSDLRKKGF